MNVNRCLAAQQLKYAYLQVCGLYLNALLVCLGAFLGYAFLALALLSSGAPSCVALSSGGFAASSLLAMTSPFLLAFVPLLTAVSSYEMTSTFASLLKQRKRSS